MNVTKTIAEAIADKMLEPMQKHLDNEIAKLKEYCTLIVLNQIPVSIQKEYKKNRDFFSSCYTVRLVNGNAILYNIDVDYNKVPYNNRSICFKCTNEQYDYIAKARKDISDLHKEKDNTKDSIIATLLSLRTIKRVINDFPSAAPFAEPYLEKKTTTLVLPIESIDKTLKKYATN